MNRVTIYQDCKGSNPSDFSKFIKNKLTIQHSLAYYAIDL